MGMWLNNECIVESNVNKKKPCHKLGYCPYGQLVEEFLLRNPRHKKFSCRLFGHDCPVFYHAEDVTEDKKKGRKDEVGNKK